MVFLRPLGRRMSTPMALTLSLNTNPLVNRFADPDDLIETTARDLKIRDLQLTHEFINPSWQASTIRRLTRQMKAAMQRTGVRVTSGMTGPTAGSIISDIPMQTFAAITSTGSRPLPTSSATLEERRSERSSQSSPTGTMTIRRGAKS